MKTLRTFACLFACTAVTSQPSHSSVHRSCSGEPHKIRCSRHLISDHAQLLFITHQLTRHHPFTNARFALAPQNYPPFYTYDATSSLAPYSGYIPALIDVLAAEIDIEYELVPTVHSNGMALSYDPASGMFTTIDPAGPLATKVVDAEMIPTSLEAPVANSYAMLSDEKYILTGDVISTATSGLRFREALKNDRTFALFDPFATDLWIATCVALLTYSGTSTTRAPSQLR